MATANKIELPERGLSWGQQRILKKESIPTQEYILAQAKQIDNIRTRALFILCYLTAGRITELVRCKKLKRVTYQRVESINKYGDTSSKILYNYYGSPKSSKVEYYDWNYEGIKKSDISITERKGKPILIISIQNRKNKTFTRKSLPIPINRELELCGLLNEYLELLNEEDSLFPFGAGMAWKIIRKNTGYNPHFIRDIRLTHLITIYDFNAFQLTKFAGWKNSAPAERYVRLSVSDLVDKF